MKPKARRASHPVVPPEPTPAPLGDVIGELPPELQPPDPDSPRGRILAAARLLFAEHGYGATSTRAVAERSGVNLAMIHYYFGSKEQLYERVLAFEIQHMFRSVLPELPRTSPPEEALFAIPLRLMAVTLQAPVWTTLLRREVADGGTHLRRAIHQLGGYGPLGARELFVSVYRDAVRAGRLRDLPPDAVREMLIALGFAAVFVAPLFAVFDGRDFADPKVATEWTQTISTVLHYGLIASGEHHS